MNYKLIAYAQDFASFLLEKLDKESDNINQIILFGSVSRGESESNSDVDIFIDVLEEKSEKKIENIKEKYYDSVKVKKYWNLLGINNELHCVIGKLDNWGDLKSSILANGITLYGKYKGQTELDYYALFLISSGKSRSKSVSIWRHLYGYKQKVGKKTYTNQGLLLKYEGKKLSRGTFIVPIEHAVKIEQFLKNNKIFFKMSQIWLEKNSF